MNKRIAALALLLCVTVAQPGLAQGKTFALDVHDTDIYDVIRLLGSTADVNLIPEGSIKHDRVTLRLRDVTFDEALRALAEAFDLQTHREGSVVLIGPSAQMNRRYGIENGSTCWRRPITAAMIRRVFNAIYPDLAKAFAVPLYPFFLQGVAADARLNQADGLHPTAEGVDVIVTNILPAVEAFLGTINGQRS